MEKKYCCEEMEYFSKLHCDIHGRIWDCPDCLVYFDDREKNYGLIVHDGGQSYVEIRYCPWCGKQLS